MESCGVINLGESPTKKTKLLPEIPRRSVTFAVSLIQHSRLHAVAMLTALCGFCRGNHPCLVFRLVDMLADKRNHIVWPSNASES